MRTRSSQELPDGVPYENEMTRARSERYELSTSRCAKMCRRAGSLYDELPHDRQEVLRQISDDVLLPELHE